MGSRGVRLEEWQRRRSGCFDIARPLRGQRSRSSAFPGACTGTPITAIVTDPPTIELRDWYAVACGHDQWRALGSYSAFASAAALGRPRTVRVCNCPTLRPTKCSHGPWRASTQTSVSGGVIGILSL